MRSYLGEVPPAQRYIDRALQVYDQLNAPDPHAHALYAQSRIHRIRGNLRDAQATMEESLRIVRSMRRESSSRDLRISFSSSRYEYNDYYIDLLIELDDMYPGQGYAERALEAFDQNQARTLIESLVEAEAGIRQNADARLLDRETKLLAMQSQIDWQIISLSRRSKDSPQLDALEAERRDLERQLENVAARLRSSSRRYADLSAPEPLSAAQIQNELLDPETLLLAFSLGNRRSFLWLVSQSSVEAFKLAPRWQIEKLTQHLIDKTDGPFSRKKSLEGIIRNLSQVLLAPLKGKLERKRLVIVGDGPILYIPFDALASPTAGERQPPYSRPLVLDHEIVMSPSASTTALLRRQAAQRPPAPRTLAVLADPVFDQEDERVRKRQPGILAKDHQADTLSNQRFRRLPYSAQEARSILSLVEPSQRLEILGFGANRKALFGNSGLELYRIVHIATHGVFHPEYPQLSSIVLSLVTDQLESGREGLIRAHEIYRLRLSADLVVLSGCETALGKQFRGEGIVGLTRGFMYAGAARVAVSLWKVNDEATSVLMRHFYEAMLLQHLPPSAALRRAKIKMLDDSKWNDPYYWAGFILQGDWR